jgi:type II secretory pathway predicted ATPase ExeA
MSALSQLSRAIPVRGLLGPHSSGRSALLRHLAARGDSETCRLLISGPQRQRSSVIRALLKAAGLDEKGLRREGRKQLLNVYLRERIARGQQILILVDDADQFGPSAFDELLRLRQEAQGSSDAIDLLLGLEHIDAASSPAADFMRSDRAPGITVLTWMNTTEVGWYLNWRLERFGLAGLFTSNAIQHIARTSRGCFAAVDYLSQMALLLQRKHSASHVDAALARNAVRAFHGEPMQDTECSLEDSSRPAEPTDADSVELIISKDGEILRRVICSERLLIGRSSFNDVHLDDQYLSRNHLAIVRRASGFYASDLNSVNGVRLNGNPIHSAPLADGDLIRIGPYSLKVLLRGVRQAACAEVEAAALTETAQMPAPDIPEPARLKLVK